MTDKDYTHIALVVDRSGSMQGIHTDMNGAILKLLSEQAKEPGTVLVDVTTFDTEIDHPFTGVRPDDVKGPLIEPRGGTALNDAIGFTIVNLGNFFRLMNEEDRPGLVMVVVVTDGMENSSREYKTEQIKELVEQQTNEWGWQFVYLAANVDAFETGSGYGFSRGSTIAFEASSAGTQNVYGSVSKGMSATRMSMRNGATENLTFDEKDREEAMEK